MLAKQATTKELKQDVGGLKVTTLELKRDFNELKQSVNELKEGMDFIQDFLMNHMLTREEAYATFSTKAELFSFKSDILTAIDAISVRQITFDQEFTVVRSKSFDHEDCITVIEDKLKI